MNSEEYKGYEFLEHERQKNNDIPVNVGGSRKYDGFILSYG